MLVFDVIFNNGELGRHFDCLAWLSISQKFVVNNLLREILYSVKPDERNKKRTTRDDELTSELEEYLAQRRYLIVLDDVWEVDLWESLRKALPDGNYASRVLITTRIVDVARAADRNSTPYKLRHLDENESLTLLFQKANIPIGESGVQFRTDLNDVARQLTKMCAYLPLALIVLGSILSRRERTKNAWQRVHDTLDWHDEKAKRCSEVLLLSYVELPYHLKPCFLYFASFPEDHEISANHVIRMWIAEGFIPRDGRGNMEERAQNILDELLQRSLVQVIKKSWDGKCKTCRVHDLVRDMAVHEARQENFFTLFTKEDDDIQLSTQKVRRAMLQCSPPTNFGIHSKFARSLLLFEPYEYKLNFSGFRLLKVLSIVRVHFQENKFIDIIWLEGLIHLRYLGFRYCQLPLKFFSINFSYLKNLETVDFKGTDLSYASRIGTIYFFFKSIFLHSLWKVPSLRHVNFGYLLYGLPGRWSVPLRLASNEDHHKNIQKLKIGLFTARRCVKERWQNLKALLKQTKHLFFLHIVGDNHVPLLSEGTRDLSCHKTIQSLHLNGKWEDDLCVLNLEMLPTNLAKLTLFESGLNGDPMPVLERLQSLTILRLREYSFIGTKLTCSEGGFPRLQKLELIRLPHVSHWDIEKGAMPRLSHLKMIRLNCLQVLPELQNVPTLQNIVLDQDLYEISGRPDNQYKIRHILSVRQMKISGY
ncbi:Disease resistance protein RPP8 [Rhynchospora pubera]|uniref:Disease resistance protein RPP8 n=1 Tax=Rhynchospora pubera TaxID=906938 RepID=A0AAV8FY51_9POAL|nr:Disease resistance protein RPP8 [Rhynchospora pubera]